MKIDNIDDVRGFIEQNAPKFLNEFITNGIEMYRTVDNGLTIEVRKTPESIHPIGRVEQTTTPMLEPIFAAGGLPSRVNNVLFTISKDANAIALSKPTTCLVVPLGDYSMAFIEGLNDFNNVVSMKSGIGHDIMEYREMIEFIETETSGNRNEFIDIMTNNNKQAAYSSIDVFVDQIGVPADLRDAVIEESKRLWDIFNPSSINSYIKTSPSVELKNNACEVIFNCEKYLLINTDLYTWESLFPEHYK